MPLTSSRSRGARLSVVAALALSVVAGCSGLSLPFSGGAPQPTIPRRTSAPTFAPRANATPEPTLAPVQPTASPEVNVPTRTVSYASFRRHVLRADRQLKPLARQMKRAARAHDLDAIRKGVRTFRKWAEAELSWAQAREPQQCFAEFYGAWRETLDLLHQGLVLMEDGLSPVDMDELRRGRALIERADENYEPGDAATCRS